MPRSAACGDAKRTRVIGVVFVVVIVFTGPASSSDIANPEHGHLDLLGWTWDQARALWGKP